MSEAKYSNLRMNVFGSLLVFSIALSACSTNTQSQPDAKATVNQRASTGKGSTQDASRGGQNQSSLDALRRGEVPTTALGGGLREVFFDFDSYQLTAQSRTTLQMAADWLKKNRAARIEIEGHCDERGTSEYNLALGAKRAQAAKDYLVSLGVTANRLATTSYGEEIPVCRDANESCWGKNRRDRFVNYGGKTGTR